MTHWWIAGRAFWNVPVGVGCVGVGGEGTILSIVYVLDVVVECVDKSA
jgi:hypothetical protein